MIKQLKEIHDKLAAGDDSPEVSLNEFLRWFGAKRRGYWIVRDIREQMGEAKLYTDPDFENVWWGGNVSFGLREQSDDSANDSDDDSQLIEIADDNDAEGSVWISKDATYRISRLQAANKDVVTACLDETIQSVVTKMLKGGFSQLPVVSGRFKIRGVVSWQSIGSHFALGRNGESARDFLENHYEISNDKSVFDAIPTIVSNDYVIVTNKNDGTIKGIITAADLSLQFRELTEPFLLISEIENLIRNMIGANFNLSDLKACCDPADASRKEKISKVSDLSFGEYVRLLDHDKRWSKIGIALDRAEFCRDLDKIREIRNDVAHFNPEGIDPDDLNKLRDFTRFLQNIAKITSNFRT